MEKIYLFKCTKSIHTKKMVQDQWIADDEPSFTQDKMYIFVTDDLNVDELFHSYNKMVTLENDMGQDHHVGGGFMKEHFSYSGCISMEEDGSYKVIN